MTEMLVDSARLLVARARLYAFTERLALENLAADYQRGRDPTGNLNQLLELQALKGRLGIQRSNSS